MVFGDCVIVQSNLENYIFILILKAILGILMKTEHPFSNQIND